MLKNAIDYERELAIKSLFESDKEDNKYFVFDVDDGIVGAKYIKLYKKNNYFEFVSIDNQTNNVIGFFRYYVENNCAYNVETICFYKDKSIIYGLDIYRLLNFIFLEQKLEEINFSVNSNFEYINKKYNNFIKRGLGEIYNEKLGYKFYKVSRNNYLEYVKNRKTK